MSKGNARQEAKPQTIETTSPILIDSAAPCKKDCLHILHVDDDVCILEVSKQILSIENNFEIDTATSVDEAFKKMEKQTFDAVVSDYEMPLKNGLDLLKELRGKRSDIPFILFTGKGREDVAVEALNLGADSYINKTGSPETVYCELADAINKTVERKKSRKLLAESESKYRMLVEKSLQGILITLAAPLRLVFANDAMGKILGYSSQEFMALSPEGIMGLVYHEDRAVFFRRMENRLRGEPAESCFEFRAVRKDGSILWMSALANRVDYDGQPAVQGMFLDVSESKKAAEILRESEQRYRELANSLPDIIFEADMKGQLVFANERATEISGYSQGELEKGLNVLQFLAPEDRGRAAESIQRLLTGGSYVPTEYTFVRKDGTTFPALITATPRISKNKMTGLRGLVIDITEHKKAEETLRLSEKRYRGLFEGMSEGFALCEIITDAKGLPCDYRILEVNDAYEKQTGLNRADVEGKRVREFFPDVESSRIEILGKVALTGEPIRFENYNHNTNRHCEAFAFSPAKGQFAVLLADTTERKKAEKALQESEEKLRTIFEGASDGIIVADSKTKRFVFANPRICEITGYSLEELLQLNVSDIHPEKDLPYVTDQFTKQMQEKITLATDIPVLRKDRKVVYCDVNSRPAKIGEQEYLVGFFRDITERKKAEQAASASLKRYQSFIEVTGELGWVTNAAGEVAEDTPSFRNFTGQTYDEVKGWGWIKAVHPEDVEHATRAWQAAVAAKTKYEVEYRLRRCDGVYRNFMVRGAPIFEEDGKIREWVGTCIDITERKKAEEVLRESEASFRSLIDSMDDLVFVLGFDGIFKNYHQPSHKKELYVAPEEFIGKHFLDVLPPKVAELCQAAMKRIEDSGETQELDYYMEMNGEKSWYNARFSPTKDQSGRKTSVTIVVRNITERKKAEDAIARLASFPALNPNPVVEVDSDGKINYVNPAAESAFPNLEKDGLNHPFFSGWNNVVATVKNEKTQTFSRNVKIGDAWFLQQFSLVPETQQVRIYVTNITEVKQAEEALRESETKFRMYVENSPVAVFVADSEGKYQYVNEAASKLLGYSAKELLRMSIPEIIFKEEHPTLNNFATLQETGKILVEVRLKKKDGQAVYVSLNAVKLPNGKLIAFCENITERNEAEEALNRTMDELVRVNEKLNVVGSLTRHDVRNKLLAVTGNAFMLKKKHADQADVKDGLGKIEQACKEIGEIFDFAKMYEQLGVEELTYIDVEKTLNEALGLFSGSLNVKVINDCRGLTLLADSFVRQLFFNLIDNSVKHGKKITTISVHYEKADQDRLNLIYEDDGIGISVDNKPKLFKSGFSTGGSSGYGLYLIRKMIEVYGWAIQENGEPAMGARFTITIPRTNQKGKENFRIA